MKGKRKAYTEGTEDTEFAEKRRKSRRENCERDRTRLARIQMDKLG